MVCLYYIKKYNQSNYMQCFQASNNGMTNTVCTLYELVNGDDTTSEGNFLSLNFMFNYYMLNRPPACVVYYTLIQSVG